MPIGSNTIAASIGATGGSKDAIVVSHTHTATSTVTDPGHNHSGNGYAGKGTSTSNRLAIGDTNSVFGQMPVNAATGVTVATSISTEGSSGTNANMPPYLGINFIIKT
jgi:microcystin-dependent protein